MSLSGHQVFGIIMRSHALLWGHFFIALSVGLLKWRIRKFRLESVTRIRYVNVSSKNKKQVQVSQNVLRVSNEAFSLISNACFKSQTLCFP